MLNMVATVPAALPAWTVELRVELPGGGRPPLSDEDVEPMVELLYRTEGVRSAAVVPLDAGLLVAVCLDAPDAAAALERARGLTTSCARYAGFGDVTVSRTHVVPDRD
jgi:hypothetical protein